MSRSILLFSLILLSFASIGQKKKLAYKDVFVYLSNNQFAEAEPLLRQYLRENETNANAFMFMGYIFENRFQLADFLKQPRESASLADSAIFYLDLCIKNLTEKELKRNDEYYQAFSRRDFRTGEFGVKLSDINFDLNKKIESLRELQQQRAKLFNLFTGIQSSCSRLDNQFKTLTKNFRDSRALYLRGGTDLILGLQSLMLTQDSLVNTYESFKLISEQAGNNRYLRELQLNPVKDFSSSDITCPEYFKAVLSLFDFKSWAIQILEVIEKNIRPAIDQLIAVDTEINKLHERIQKDSVSVLNELGSLDKKVKETSLVKFDAQPFPVLLLELKLGELAHGSEKALGRLIRASDNLPDHAKQDRNELNTLLRLDSLCASVKNRDLEKDELDYRYFIENTFGNLSVLNIYLNSTTEYAQQQTVLLNNNTQRLNERLKWIISGMDSIPAQEGVNSPKWLPLLIEAERYTVGLHTVNDQMVQGYFYQITGSRMSSLHAEFPLDPVVFAKHKSSLLTAQITGSKDGSVYFTVLSSKEIMQGKSNVNISKIYAADGLSWSNSFNLPGVPVQVSYLQDSGDLSVTIETNAGQQILLVGKDGKLKS
jgi:hypothetical protein